MRPLNLVDMVRRTVDRHPDRTSLMWKEDGSWRSISYRQLWERIRLAAAGLAAAGVQAGDHVAILSENNPMWPVTDLAVASLGAVSVPVYPTLTAEQAAFILRQAECRAAVVENEGQLEKVMKSGADIRPVVVMKPGPGFMGADGILTFDELLREGELRPLKGWEDGWRRIGRDRLATIIHTSGTTGRPKGVMLSHGNILSNVEGVLFWCMEGRPDDVFLSYLPLSHVFERMAGQFAPLSVGAAIAYAESIEAIQDNLLEVRPTVMTSVPRLFEKVHARVRETIRSAPPLRRKLFEWALKVGNRRYELYLRLPIDAMMLRDGMPPGLKLQWRIADLLVYRKVKERLGGRIRGFISGGAALHPEIARFFWSLDIPVLEGYGLTESSPVIAANPMARAKVGTVGKPLPNVEVRLAEDGEVLVRGPNVMQGYYRNPEETAEAIQDGWLRTGDVGEWDEDGYLRIVDRKKSLLVLSTGKNVAPQPIESAINQSPYIDQSLLVGHGQKFVVVLIVPDFETLFSWAKRRGLPAVSGEELVRHPETVKLLEEEVARQTASFAPFERPKKIWIADRPWTVESGELTPTLKVKAREVERRYREEIARLYVEEARQEQRA